MKILKSIDPREIREVESLVQRQRMLHIAPSPVVYLTAEVRALDGEPVARYEDRSHSWVRNYYNWMATQTLARAPGVLGATFGAGTLVTKCIDSSLRTSTVSCLTISLSNDQAVDYGMRGNAGNTQIGIVVGTGTAPENFDDYCLSAIVPHGINAGQMQYQEMTAGTLTWDSTNKKFVQVLERLFINNSGAAITVTEAGIYASLLMSSTISYTMIARDVLSPAVEVPNSSQLKVTYTIELALPA